MNLKGTLEFAKLNLKPPVATFNVKCKGVLTGQIQIDRGLLPETLTKNHIEGAISVSFKELKPDNSAYAESDRLHKEALAEKEANRKERKELKRKENEPKKKSKKAKR